MLGSCGDKIWGFCRVWDIVILILAVSWDSIWTDGETQGIKIVAENPSEARLVGRNLGNVSPRTWEWHKSIQRQR